MRLELSEPQLVDVLIAQLRALDCGAKRAGESAIDVDVPQTGEDWHPANQAQVELAFLVRAWLARHPGVEFRLVDDGAGPSAANG